MTKLETAQFYYEHKVDLKRRLIWLEGEIDDVTVGQVMRMLDFLTSVNSKKPICLYINSEGGSVVDGLALINFIKLRSAPVTTITLGAAYSMALTIFLAGQERHCFPCSKFMNHKVESKIQGNEENMKSTLKNIEHEESMCNVLFKNTKKSIAWWTAQAKGVDFFFSAREALKLGVVTKIIGE